ncbi:MAG: hypothetical protein ACREEV_11020 [Dongiaceae bacterium]
MGALLAAVLGGCAASQNPLGPESEAVTEPRLAGAWQYAGDKGGGWDYLHIIPGGNGSSLEIVAINSEDKGWTVLSGYVTAVGERRFVNLRIVDASAALKADLDKQAHKDSHPFSFVAVRFDGDDRLSVAYPLEQLHAAVKDGRLAGEIVGDYDVYVGDSSANIAALLGGLGDGDLFKDPLLYRRISAPSP